MKINPLYLRKVMKSDLEAFKQMKRKQIQLDLKKFEERERLRETALSAETLPQTLTVEGDKNV